MTRNDFDTFFERLIEEMRETLVTKGADYTIEGRDDRLDNFKRQAEVLALRPEQVWATYFHKHVDSLMRWARSGQVESEGLRNRFIDIGCYAILGAALAQEIASKKDTQL